MELRPEEMKLFNLDYGDLIRPTFRIVTGKGWAQCTNQTNEFLVVYGPKHGGEQSIFDTSPYVLPPGATTPDRWDCKGYLLPSDRLVRSRWRRRRGPLAIKFWNGRRFWVRSLKADTYENPWHNGAFEPSQIKWAIPNFTYDQIKGRIDAR